MTQDATTKAIAAANGYYECGTAAGTAAKVAVGDNEALYVLQKGGSIKVKMTNANAAASGVTLKIGSSAATPLYYNNEPVSASNTWEAGEVISVYYDGSVYQASNAQGGGGKAEKIKYNNSQSGLAAQNVQGALDEIEEDYKNQFESQLSKLVKSNWTINNKATYLTNTLGFEVGKRYRIRLEIPTALTQNIAILLAPNASSQTGNKRIGTLLAGETYTDFTYAPLAASNYQYMYIWNNDPATTATLQIWEYGETDLQDELTWLNDKDKIVKSTRGTFLKLFPDLTNSVITTENSQHGLLYQVKSGEHLLVEYTNSEYFARYAFVKEYPYPGLSFGESGLIKNRFTEITSDVDGYLIITRTAAYPVVSVHTLNNHYNYITELGEFKASRADIKFGHKLSYNASSLSVRSNATYADGVITIASGGSAKGTVNMFHDDIIISATIKPTSDTFSIQFGQYEASQGTMVGLRTDGSSSYLDLYAGTTLKKSIELGFALASGVEYSIRIKHIVLDYPHFYIDISSNNGYCYSYDTSSAATSGRMWGALYCKAVSGTCEVSNINVYSPYKQGCRAAVVGHSFVESYTINSMMSYRFARLLQDNLGIEECGIFGQGGCTMAQTLTMLQNYIPQYSPKYVLCCVGTNDNSMTLANWKTWRNNVITACNVMGSIPVFFTMPPDGGSYEGAWNSINAFIRTCGSLYVDMDKCFTNSGSPVAARYLYDNTHPNPETHRSIYLRILQDVPQLLDKEDELQEIQKEVDLINLVPDYTVTDSESVNLVNYATQTGALGSNGWTVGAGASHKAIPVTAGDTFVISGDGTNAWGWVTSSYNPPHNNNDPIPYVTGYTRRFSGAATVQTAPEGAAYLIVGTVNGAGTAGTWNIVKINSYEYKNKSNFVKFKFATWNIGIFKYYNYHNTHQTSDISDADADRIALEYRQIINTTGADILGICEYDTKYPRHNSSGSTRDIIFSCYKQARIGTYIQASSCNAVFMNSPQHISTSEKIFDHTVKKDGIDTNEAQRYYINVLCKIAGKEVHIIEAHLDWKDSNIRALQIQELVTVASNYPYVIIGGDFNTVDNVETEMLPFINAGFNVANSGYIGSFVTHESSTKLDNIVTKGFAMSNIKVDENAGNLSDHWIVSCDLEMLNS